MQIHVRSSIWPMPHHLIFFLVSYFRKTDSLRRRTLCELRRIPASKMKCPMQPEVFFISKTLATKMSLLKFENSVPYLDSANSAEKNKPWKYRRKMSWNGINFKRPLPVFFYRILVPDKIEALRVVTCARGLEASSYQRHIQTLSEHDQTGSKFRRLEYSQHIFQLREVLHHVCWTNRSS